MKFETAKEFCEDNGFTSRASRYEIMSQYFGVPAGTIKEIMSFDRYLRDIFPVDAVGIEKEAEYHKSGALFAFENESKKLIKDKIKFA